LPQLRLTKEPLLGFRERDALIIREPDNREIAIRHVIPVDPDPLRLFAGTDTLFVFFVPAVLVRGVVSGVFGLAGFVCIVRRGFRQRVRILIQQFARLRIELMVNIIGIGLLIVRVLAEMGLAVLGMPKRSTA